MKLLTILLIIFSLNLLCSAEPDALCQRVDDKTSITCWNRFTGCLSDCAAVAQFVVCMPFKIISGCIQTRCSMPELNDNVFTMSSHDSDNCCGSWQPTSEACQRVCCSSIFCCSCSTLEKAAPVLVGGVPINYRAYLPKVGTRKAIIFEVYGGKIPRVDYTGVWPFCQRILADQGYCVVSLTLSDVYGKDSSGNAFPDDQSKYTQAHIDQLMNEILECVKEFKNNPPFSIPKDIKFALSGHSFGGMLTLCCATNSKFDGAVDCFIASAPPTYEFNQPIYIVSSSQNIGLDALNSFSPLCGAANVTKPVLLMHSPDDIRVPIDHSLRFYEAVKAYYSLSIQTTVHNNAASGANVHPSASNVSFWCDLSGAGHEGFGIINSGFSKSRQYNSRIADVMKKFIDTPDAVRAESHSHYLIARHAPVITDLSDLATGLCAVSDEPKDIFETSFYRHAMQFIKNNTNLTADDLSKRLTPSIIGKFFKFKSYLSNFDKNSKFVYHEAMKSRAETLKTQLKESTDLKQYAEISLPSLVYSKDSSLSFVLDSKEEDFIKVLELYLDANARVYLEVSKSPETIDSFKVRLASEAVADELQKYRLPLGDMLRVIREQQF